MSLNYTQITQLIDRNVKSNSSSYTLADKTADINIALDEVFALIFEQGGTWQFDDSNHDDYPIITTDLLSGVRDYAFVDDERGNLILDIYKVLVKNEAGIYVEVLPVDVQSEANMAGFYDGQNVTGLPTRHDKTANGIFLDKIPSYDSTDGLKIYINRESSYFDVSDTGKKPGFSGLFHEYLALKPSYMYAYRNGLVNTAVLQNEMLRMREAIKRHYGRRERDIKRRLIPKVENNR